MITEQMLADAYAMNVPNLRRRAQAVYLSCDEEVAKDISAALLWAADEIERLANHIDDCVRVAADALKRAEAERERCAQVAISFGDFPGGSVVKDIRVMCGSAIADKIREGITTLVGGVVK